VGPGTTVDAVTGSQAEPETPATRRAPGDLTRDFVLPDADGMPVALSSFAAGT